MKVSPVHSDLVINQGKSATVDVYVTNVTGQTATFQVAVNDFVSSGDESGNPALILNNNESAPKHSLKQYVAPFNNITLKPNEQKDVKVIINIPPSAVAGGYFGAVRFVPADSNSGKNVSLTASVASLILVKVPGNIKEQVGIESIDVRTKDKSRSIFTSNKDINVVVRFRNSGDVQEQPFGKVTVKNMRGKEIDSVEINNGQVRGSVLPDSVRKFAVPIKNVASFGRYTVHGDFGYANGQTLTGSTTFYVIPVPIIITILVVIILLIVAVFEIPRMIKRYNQRILRRAGR